MYPAQKKQGLITCNEILQLTLVECYTTRLQSSSFNFLPGTSKLCIMLTLSTPLRWINCHLFIGSFKSLFVHRMVCSIIHYSFNQSFNHSFIYSFIHAIFWKINPASATVISLLFILHCAIPYRLGLRTRTQTPRYKAQSCALRLIVLSHGLNN
jgi:hypothetical protein